VPIDVAAADITRETQDEDTVLGGYAWVLTSGGPIYLINISPLGRSIKAVVHDGQSVLFDPDPTSMASYVNNPFVYRAGTTPDDLVREPTPYPNRPRDRNFDSYSTALDPTLGLPRLDVPPVALASGPYIESLWTQGTETDTTALDTSVRETSIFFPDREAAVQQSWDVVWQGTIISPRYSGTFDTGTDSQLNDFGGGFCSSGVLRGDIVTLNGCTADAQCPLGMVCLQDPTLDQVPGGLTVTGLCVADNLRDNKSRECAALTGSVRRYEITDAHEGTLKLKPHLDEIVRSSLSPCRIVDTGTAGTSGAAGMAGAGGTGGMAGAGGTGGTGTGGTGGMGGAGGTAGAGGAPQDDCFDPTDGTTRQFACVQLPGIDGPRCLNHCTKDQDCRHGRTCQPYTACTPADKSRCPTGTTDCLCLDGASCARGAGLCLTAVVCQDQKECADDQVCAALNPNDPSSPKQCAFTIQNYCADGPPLDVQTEMSCFPQLTAYQVNANASFYVTGSLSGSLAAGQDDATNGCQEIPTRDKRLVARIPLRPAPGATPLAPGTKDDTNECSHGGQVVFPTLQTDQSAPAVDGFFIDRFDPRIQPSVINNTQAPVLFTSPDARGMPAAMMARPEAPQLVDWMVGTGVGGQKGWTKDITAQNACLYLGGPVIGDPPSSPDPTTRPERLQHVRARFRNTQIAFILANIDRGPPAGNTIHFDVHGGFRPESVLVLPTVEISAPARLVLSPIDSNQVSTVTMKPVPFFFVVDQRRLGTGQGGGPTRGQILRVNPFGQPTTVGYLPAYEDYQRSGGLFPIQ
jgi:hypothetical protein